jgi:hypothetical protein
MSQPGKRVRAWHLSTDDVQVICLPGGETAWMGDPDSQSYIVGPDQETT